jgi:hypothetical protein
VTHPIRRIAAALPAALLALTAVAPGAHGQATLRADGRLAGSYAQLSDVVEMAPGKVFFADTRERKLFSGDFADGQVTMLGRKADSVTSATPADTYKFPGWLAPLGGGTVGVVDFAALRTTVWDRTGKALRVLPVPIVAGKAPVLAYDTLGYGYKVDYQAILGGNEPGHPVRTDSVPVLRINLKTGKADTIAKLSAPEYGDARIGEQTQSVAKIFGPNDLFGVFGDGTIWIARGHLNVVDWRDPKGRWTRGPSKPFTPVPVTQADRDRVMQQLKQSGLPTGVSTTFPFAETKPPFEAALTRPSGEVWLLRPRAADSAAAVYDVYGKGGKPVRQVTAPAGVIVAGFGAGDVVYGADKQGDGRAVTRYHLR